jgi:hypothetical protein
MKYLFLTILLFSFSAHAQQKVEKPETYDCKVEKDKILEDLMEPVQCVQDDECGYFDYGFPFQPDICLKAIINVKKQNHNIANLSYIAQYNNFCTYPNEEERKKKIEFEKTAEIKKCNPQPRVYCYKGFCRIQSYAIYNDK